MLSRCVVCRDDRKTQMYALQPTGLAPEISLFRDEAGMIPNPRAAHNLQRPETVESLFLLYRKTGEEKYRQMGWDIFEAFMAHTRVRAGFTGVKDVRKLPAEHDDTQQSFWLAETLKYFYLLYSDRRAMRCRVLADSAAPRPRFGFCWARGHA